MATATVWEVRAFRSRYSRRVAGVLHVEGRTRREALSLLAALVEAPGAAGELARDVAAGRQRVALRRLRGRHPYAAADGYWRGWSEEDWQADPPRAYAQWQREGR